MISFDVPGTTAESASRQTDKTDLNAVLAPSALQDDLGLSLPERQTELSSNFKRLVPEPSAAGQNNPAVEATQPLLTADVSAPDSEPKTTEEPTPAEAQTPTAAKAQPPATEISAKPTAEQLLKTESQKVEQAVVEAQIQAQEEAAVKTEQAKESTTERIENQIEEYTAKRREETQSIAKQTAEYAAQQQEKQALADQKEEQTASEKQQQEAASDAKNVTAISNQVQAANSASAQASTQFHLLGNILGKTEQMIQNVYHEMLKAGLDTPQGKQLARTLFRLEELKDRILSSMHQAEEQARLQGISMENLTTTDLAKMINPTTYASNLPTFAKERQEAEKRRIELQKESVEKNVANNRQQLSEQATSGADGTANSQITKLKNDNQTLGNLTKLLSKYQPIGGHQGNNAFKLEQQPTHTSGKMAQQNQIQKQIEAKTI